MCNPTVTEVEVFFQTSTLVRKTDGVGTEQARIEMMYGRGGKEKKGKELEKFLKVHDRKGLWMSLLCNTDVKCHEAAACPASSALPFVYHSISTLSWVRYNRLG